MALLRAGFQWAALEAPGRIAIRGRPAGGAALDDELLQMKANGVDVLVSLLCEREAALLGLSDEAGAAARAGLEFLSFPIVDHDVPRSLVDTVAFADDLAARYADGRSIVLHCFAGIGRSALVAIAMLIRAGHSLDDAARTMSRARGLRVPETREQLAFLALLEAQTRSA